MSECEADAARSAGDEDVAVLDWDLDGAGSYQEVEDGEEEQREENEEGEECVRHGCSLKNTFHKLIVNKLDSDSYKLRYTLKFNRFFFIFN